MYLEKEGFSVEHAANGNDAINRFEQIQPQLVVLDVMMPGMDGFEVCREMRRDSDVPILMLTARSEDVDKIVGLELGADDYMTKPFNPRGTGGAGEAHPPPRGRWAEAAERDQRFEPFRGQGPT